ncbi:hypothetical protein HNR00_000082 [Methylorubrum rhodinum]|uniref:Uncharacterized protein n=1 Tax=Methylorubrum rhodinum TaxID=29428 RepID=A0A840ZEM5_9HYPH|nr:DUF5677 domain-containing protein [Methylorubrum rhodinum]MBB5755393.1 hypothetical protein [Methylorubrum rhodinum]
MSAGRAALSRDHARPVRTSGAIDVSNSINLEDWIVWPKDHFQKIFEEALDSKTDGELELPDEEPPDEKELNGIIRSEIDKFSTAVSLQIIKKAPFDRISYLIEYEQTEALQQILLRKVWGLTFEQAKYQWFIARDTYSYVYKNHTSRFKKSKREAIGSIITRSLLVYREILALCEAGFPDGAVARWRTLYELYIVFLSIRKMGGKAYELFLVSEQMQKFRYQESLERQIGNSSKKFEALRKEIESLRRTYGIAITEDYGWATICLNKKRVNLRDLEIFVGHELQRAEVKFVSKFIHAGHLSPDQFLAFPDWAGSLSPIVGPSPYGIQYPINEAARTLTLLALEIAGIKYTMDTIILSKANVANYNKIENSIRISLRLLKLHTQEVNKR